MTLQHSGSHQKGIRNHPRCMMKQIIKHAVAKAVGKNIHMQPVALKMPRKMLSDMVWPGRQKFFNTIAEKFYPRVKIFRGTILS